MEIPARFNAATLLRRPARRRGARRQGRRSSTRTRSLTYGGDRRSWSTARATRSSTSACEPEQRVLLLLLDSPEFLATFWGAIKIGAVPIPVNTMMRAAGLPLLPRRQPRARGRDLGAAARRGGARSLGQARYLKHVVVAGTPERRADRLRRLDRAGRRRRLEAADTSQGRARRSGSTPRARRAGPKGAVHLQHDMVVSAARRTRAQVLGMTESDRTVSAAKLFFAYGLGNNLYFPMGVGGAGRALSAPAAPRGHVRADPPPPAHAVLRRPDALRRHARR